MNLYDSIGEEAIDGLIPKIETIHPASTGTPWIADTANCTNDASISDRIVARAILVLPR
jgi:hypothetical protein